MQRRVSSRSGVTRPCDGVRVSRCRRPSLSGLALVGLMILLLSPLIPSPAAADPDFPGPILYGLDPLLRSTDDPRLLGVDRLILRQRLLQMGLDPLKENGRAPDIRDNLRRLWIESANVDLVRLERVVEYNGPLGMMTVLEYPKFFYLFPSPEVLPGGVTYYPPRPVTDSVVRVFLDDLETGSARKRAVDRAAVRNKKLDVAGGGMIAGQDDGLINLTIPIKLPRTLEKIIGRGEKTKIKISGREHISISGESTVVNPFTPTERITSQSLFPTLDMTQELQVNLSGTIGEKIIIEVDHNSAAIGPDGTKIKLMYQGLEDEIIQTIETGDVGLTLPNSQLLGYSSNKSGLFGIKVTGQAGRADFTVVASKQKAESSSKSFNSTGGQVEDNVIMSNAYLNNRFFRLDLKRNDFLYPLYDEPGRPDGYKIDLNSIVVYKAMPPGTSTDQDISNVAVYRDTTGVFWNPGLGVPPADFSSDYYHSFRWREQNFDLMYDVDNNLVAIDMRQQMAAEDYLAVIYDLVDGLGNVIKVGDRPGRDPSQQVLPGEEGQLYRRMKLLKAPANNQDEFTFYYVLRNIYSLGGAGIDETTFELRIENMIPGNQTPDQDENGLQYIRVFGLDSADPSGQGGPDGIVDMNDRTIFDLDRGLLKFPLDFPTPFFSEKEVYAGYAQVDPDSFLWDDTALQNGQTSEIYNPRISPSEYNKYGTFRIISSHAATSSSFNLGVSDIEEGSETVKVNGVVLTRDTDYDIDYNFGQITLKGEYANLSPDAKVAVDYQHTPFFGGGQTNLMGLNLGYDLGRESALSTTWLYQTKSIVGEKAKLGEEPNKHLVGNLNLSHTFKPYFLTHVANFLSLRNTEKESTLKFTGEVAVSLPNPNTKGQVYLEDFEGVDSSELITLSRTAWFWASQPHLGDGYKQENPLDTREFTPQERVDQVRWFLPENRTERRFLNPDLVNQERGETQQTMDMYLRDDDGSWDPEDWGGIMRGISATGSDFSKAQFVEIWVNDAQPDSALRSGKLHIDFGYINEDGFWPKDELGNLIVGSKEREDGILPNTQEDGVFAYEEDIGLEGDEFGDQRYSADREIDIPGFGPDSPFPRINGTARNSREDSEDLNRSGSISFDDGYFTAVIDLKETDPLVDVVYDYDDVDDLIADNISWRKYRIRIGEVDSASVNTAANLKSITHTRIWFEDATRNPADNAVRLQLSEFKFLGSRWEREGVRRVEGEELLSQGERLAGEEFFLGEVNNKENPDYYTPFTVNEVENIPEKEQSLVVDFKNLERGHMVRASKRVSARGDNYTGYNELSWYWFNNTTEAADLDLFFRVGSDTLNFYEVRYRFADGAKKTGWEKISVNIAELTNVKNGEIADDGSTFGQILDSRTLNPYDVRVVGRPDLRNVRVYYLVVANNTLEREASGQVYLNDIKLEGVKTDMGLAQNAGVRLDMGGIIKAEFDWRQTDAEFHGLNTSTGSGINASDWNLQGSTNLNDFLPMFGYRLPVTLGRRSQLERPKYELKSDIEILDEDVRNELSTLDESERFSTRLSRAPSQNAISRYLLDPLTMQVAGSQATRAGPEGRSYSKNLQGSINYDLRINGRYNFGRYPGLNMIPIVKGISFLPRKVAFGASFTSKYSESTVVDSYGNLTVRPTIKERPLDLTANIDYAPLSILDMNIRGTSKRDLLQEREMFGVNIGRELRRNYGLRLTFRVPKVKDIPDGKVYSPVRSLVTGLTKLNPSVQFQGNFSDDHNPNIPQPGDPPGTRSVSNDGRWELRGSLPLGDFFKTVIPEKKYSTRERDRLVAEQRRLEQQQQRTRDIPPEGQDPNAGQGQDPNAGPGGQPADPNAGLSPEEIREREEERLLAEAEDRLAKERDEGRGAAQPEVEAEAKPSPMAHFYNNGLGFLRNITPIKVTYTENSRSAYGRISDTVPFWYKTGLKPVLDTADTLFVSSAFNNRRSLNLSGTTKFSRTVSLDLKYGNNLEDREQLGNASKSYQQSWPDVAMAISGVEKLPLFGGGGGPNSGWFRSSTINLSYKRTKTVNNMTDLSYNPTVGVTLNPRWIMNFHNGMSATLMSTISKDNSTNNGSISDTNRLRLGLQVRHQFRAQSFLAKMGLYRPGSNPSINMDIDLSYQKNQTDRTDANGLPTTPTGNIRYSLTPRFSYQITRNLSGAVRFVYSKNKNVTTNQTTTTLGMGVEATFVF